MFGKNKNTPQDKFGDSIDLEASPDSYNPDADTLDLSELIPASVEQPTMAAPIAPTTESANTQAQPWVLSNIEIALPDDEESLWRYATDKLNLSAMSGAQAGYGLIKLKEKLGHGAFDSGLKERGLNARTTRESMQLATMLMSQPEEIQKQLTKMGKSQLIQIARLEADQIEELANADEFDELSTLSVRELRVKIRKAQADTETAHLKLEQANERVAKSRTRSNQFPEPVIHVREEAALAGLNIAKQVDDLEAMLNHMQTGAFVDALTPTSKSPDQNALERDAATGAVYNTIAMGLSRLQHLLDVYEQRGGTRFELKDHVQPLDDLELQRVGSMWAVEKALQEKKQDEERVKRTNEARRGTRGRPLTTKTK